MYVLPTSTTEALLNIHCFHTSFFKEEYEQEIKQYIENLGIQNFEIIEKKKVVFHDLLSFWNKTTAS
jgi:lycopene beta-cyclase